MPTYRVTDPDTGVTLRLTGDSPPTEAELEEIFAQYNPNQNTDSASPQAPSNHASRRRALRSTSSGDIDDKLLGSFRELLQGSTFGFSDEIGAAMAAGMATAIDGADFTEAYDDIIGNIRGEQEQFREENPALSTAAQVVGGLTSGGVGLAKAIPKVASTTGKVATGIAVGAAEGGLAGAGTADGEDLSESIAKGATIGGVLGGAVGVAGAAFTKHSEFKQQLTDLFTSDKQNIKLAKYMQDGAGKIKKDRLAGETIKQGFDEAVVAAIKGASQADKTKMSRMMRLLEKGKNNARFAVLSRPSDVVGDSLAQRVNFIMRKNKKAGKAVNSAANGLKGKTVNFEPAVNTFLKDIQDVGVQFDPLKGTVSFDGSDFEKIPGAERAITNILNRMRNTRAPDAYDVHRLKKFIDNHVEFGKTSDGSVGQAERLLKKLRTNMNEILGGKHVSQKGERVPIDPAFTRYEKANRVFKETKRALDDFQRAAGSSIDFESDNIHKSLGTLSRRVMSNVQSRGRLLDSIKVLEDTAAANGAKFEDDIYTQALFADELNSVFGSSARTSFQGETAKGVKEGVEAVASNDGLFRTSVNVASKGLEKARGINQENAIKAMKSLLSR